MDEDFELVELKLAFCYHMVNRVIGADGEVVPQEASFLRRTFPPALLKRAGFVDAKGVFTQRWHDALSEALLRLPNEVSEAERLDLIETLWRAALADDVFEPGEGAAIEHGARLLGVPKERMAARLETLVTHEVTLEITREC